MLNKIHRFLFIIKRKRKERKARDKRARCVCVHYFSCGVQVRPLRRWLSRRASLMKFFGRMVP